VNILQTQSLIILVIIGFVLLSLFSAPSQAAEIRVNAENPGTVNLTMEFDSPELSKIPTDNMGFKRLFCLAGSWIGLHQAPDFQISAVETWPIPGNVSLSYHTYLLSNASSFHFFDGVDFVISETDLPESGPWGMRMTLTTDDALSLVKSLRREKVETYPFDGYLLGLSLLISYDHNTTILPSITVRDSHQSSSLQTLDYYALQPYAEGSIEGKRAVIYELDQPIEFTRPWSERSFAALTIFTSLVLVITILFLGLSGAISQSFTIYLSLIVLDLGMLQSLSHLSTIAQLTLINFILDLAIGTGLVLVFSVSTWTRPKQVTEMKKKIRGLLLVASALPVLGLKLWLPGNGGFLLRCTQEFVVGVFIIIAALAANVVAALYFGLKWPRKRTSVSRER